MPSVREEALEELNGRDTLKNDWSELVRRVKAMKGKEKLLHVGEYPET